MAITPSSDLKLLKCPIELDNKNQLTFANTTAQYNYFNSLPKKEVDDFTYLRQNNYIRYNAHIDTILEYNYVMYRNTNYSDKWFYAYITRMEYVSDTLTNIYIEEDYYQTWMFNLTFKKSFVEREHVSDDTIGLHTISEGLETGDYITNSDPIRLMEYSTETTTPDGCYICFGVTNLPAQPTSDISSYKMINGVYGGLYYVICTDVANAKEFLDQYSDEGKLTYVQTAFMLPKCFAFYAVHEQGVSSEDRTHTFIMGGKTFRVIKPVSDLTYKYKNALLLAPDTTITINSTLNGYTPKNNKLFTKEYNNIILTNNVGTDVVFAYEDFTNHTPIFSCLGTVTPGCSTKCIPKNYRLLADSSSYKSFDYGISGAKFPICSWVGDIFTNWLTQNGVNIAVGGVTSVAQVVGGSVAVATGAGAVAGGTMIASGLGGVANTLAQIHQAHIVPEQTDGNINSGDITFSASNSVFTVIPTCIRAERAKIIDDYLSMFGYKVNSLKIPNLNSRTYWNYVKTIDINITADIPQDDLQKIKDMFNTGITLWHDPSKFLDYSQNNTIVV